MMSLIRIPEPAPSARHCSRCRALCTPDGLCPACLLRDALGPDATASPGDDDSSSEAPASSDAPVSPSAREHVPLEHQASVEGYTLLEELGRGGMGVVYLAEQTRPFRRRVALKLI